MASDPAGHDRSRAYIVVLNHTTSLTGAFKNHGKHQAGLDTPAGIRAWTTASICAGIRADTRAWNSVTRAGSHGETPAKTGVETSAGTHVSHKNIKIDVNFL